MRHSYRIPLVIGTLALALSDCCQAEYPPNNAAVLYYRGFLHYAAPQGVRIAKMKAVVRGKASLDDDLNRFIRGNHRVIEHANLAATIPFCDWGLDYERGVGMLLPDLHHARQVSDLMIANARRLAAQQDLFTDKAFAYEKTKEGFQLGFTEIGRSRVKTYDYTFKVK